MSDVIDKFLNGIYPSCFPVPITDVKKIRTLLEMLKEAKDTLRKVRYQSLITIETGPLIKWAGEWEEKWAAELSKSDGETV